MIPLRLPLRRFAAKGESMCGLPPGATEESERSTRKSSPLERPKRAKEAQESPPPWSDRREREGGVRGGSSSSFHPPPSPPSPLRGQGGEYVWPPPWSDRREREGGARGGSCFPPPCPERLRTGLYLSPPSCPVKPGKGESEGDPVFLPLACVSREGGARGGSK